MKLFLGRIKDTEAIITAPTKEEAAEVLANIFKERYLVGKDIPERSVVSAVLEELADLETDSPIVNLYTGTQPKAEHVRIHMHEEPAPTAPMSFQEFMSEILRHMMDNEEINPHDAGYLGLTEPKKPTGCTKCDSTCDKCKEALTTQNLLNRFLEGLDK